MSNKHHRHGVRPYAGWLVFASALGCAWFLVLTAIDMPFWTGDLSPLEVTRTISTDADPAGADPRSTPDDVESDPADTGGSATEPAPPAPSTVGRDGDLLARTAESRRADAPLASRTTPQQATIQEANPPSSRRAAVTVRAGHGDPAGSPTGRSMGPGRTATHLADPDLRHEVEPLQTPADQFQALMLEAIQVSLGLDLEAWDLDEDDAVPSPAWHAAPGEQPPGDDRFPIGRGPGAPVEEPPSDVDDQWADSLPDETGAAVAEPRDVQPVHSPGPLGAAGMTTPDGLCSPEEP
ncbi:hypothetical protein [Propionibacterium ruminifibrarum]|uniref:hypothetical protein n=1 Tax=Propionibacterium ruminifibrarum TaxID=1962131 RepID=UPI000E6AFF57|nr:hypothetical protein [Propionibacterium ruminifibrarum]